MALVFLGSALTSYQLHSTFDSIESSLRQGEIERIAIQFRHIGELELLLISKYAEWTKTYGYLGGSDPDYLSNHFDFGQNATGEDVVICFDSNKKLLSTRWLKAEANRSALLSPVAVDTITSSDILSDRPRLGIISDDGRLLLLTAAPVMQIDRKGPTPEWVVLGRWFDIGWLNQTFDLIGIRIRNLQLLKDSELHVASREHHVLSTKMGGLPIRVVRHDEAKDTVTFYLPTLDGKMVAALDVDIPVEVLESALTARNRILFWGAIGGIIIVVLPLLIFEWSVLRRLAQLDNEIQELSQPGARELVVTGNDEFSRLAASINRLMASERIYSARLKESETRFREAMEHSPVGMAIVELDGRWRETNSALRTFLGYSAQELTDLSFQDITFPEDLELDLEHVRKLIAGEITSYQMEKRYVRKDSHIVWALLNASIIRDDDRRPKYFVSQVLDIDESKRTARILSEAQANDRSIFEAIGDPIFVHGFDEDGQPGYLSYVNSAACRLLGLSRDQLLQRRISSLEDSPSYRSSQISAEVLTTGSATYETQLVSVDASKIPVEMHASLASLSGKKVCISVARSLVLRKAIDAQLRASKEAAERANKAKSDFLATMSHEIRTPLHGVIGFISLLKQTNLSTDQKEIVGSVEQSSRLLLALVSDVLDVSRIEAGRLILEIRPINLRRHLESICRGAELEARQHGLDFHSDIDTSLPETVLADSLRINQILGNLIGNALKFTDHGHVGLSVHASHNPSQRTCELVFSVTDTGIGISLAQQRRLFQPFTQADSSLSRKYGGTGLGLTIVRSLCELMGGSVEVRSAENKGSTFIARISVQTVQENPHADDSSRHSDSNMAEQTKGMQILITEDNPLNQKLLRRMLEKTAATIGVANNGAECVALVKSVHRDIIFMDVSMPEMDGLEATRNVRQLERERQIPPAVIVALTAGVSEADRQSCTEAGMDLFLGKPFTGESLNRILTEAIIRLAAKRS
ncbi:PAS domain S-box protein [Terrimicrobium sacchariphilum]|uniref:PAS domain S-box protein n=1 Tax=Terrimicrobium sacchariphilum TaxID=690879 RepID=UPI001EDC1C05|nr:PAS domain S-box protein [Terrimicrobium sacchariphilum]